MTVLDAPLVRLGPLRFAIGFLAIAIGVLMVVDPAQFAVYLYVSLQPELILWGWLAFLVGLSMVGVALYAPSMLLTVLVHLAAGTLLVLFDLSLVHSAADFANAHYLPLAAAVFAAPWVNRWRLIRLAGPDLLSLAIAMTGVMSGVWLLAMPGQFASTSYRLVHPWLFLLGLVFAIGGIAPLVPLLFGWRPPVFVQWGARILLGTAFCSFVVFNAWPNQFWPGLAFYGTMGTLAFLGPFVVHLDEKLDPESIQTRLTFVLFAVTLVSMLAALTLDLSVDQFRRAVRIPSVFSAGDVLTGVFLLLAGVASLVGYVLARTIANPLVSLARAVERADGSESPGLTLPRPNRPSEVRSLADALAATFETLTRQRAETTAERDRLVRILQQMPIGVIISEAPSGRMIFGNNQVAAIWRRPLIHVSKVEDYAKLKGFHPDGRRYRAEDWPIARAVRTGETVIGEQIAFERGDDTRGVMKITAGPIHDADGRIVAAVAAIEDVTEMKVTSDRLLRLQAITTRLASVTTEAELSEMIVNAAREAVGADSVSIYRLATDGNIVEMGVPSCEGEEINQFLRRISLQSELPVSQAVRVGQVVSFPSPESITQFPELQALFQRTGYYGAEVIPFYTEGHTIGALVLVFRRAYLLSSADWAFLTALASHAGATLRRVQRFESERAARQAALDALRVRDEFLAMASHELRTPITSLSGFTQLVLNRLRRDGQIDPVRLERALSEVDRQAHRLTELVEQLLNVSRLQSGRIALHSRPVDLRALVGEAIAPFAQSHPARILAFDAPDAVTIQADPLRLEQVVANLIANAVKFSPSGGPIEVKVGWESDAVASFAVRDHGIGIPREQRERIFDSFYQASRQDFQQGLGLGLFISKQIISLHGGTIAVEAPDDGGTRFVVRLPARGAPEKETVEVEKELNHFP